MLRFSSIVPFLGITFGLAWSLLAVLILCPDWVASTFGELSASNPLFMLAVYSPAIAAVVLVIFASGLDGLWRFLSRVTLWRAHWAWYLFIGLGVPLIYYAGAALKGDPVTPLNPFDSWWAAIAAIGFMLVLGPVEELGWRGFALPMLQRRFSPIVAGLIVGAIWGGWHLPAFFLSGVPQGTWSFLPFFVGAIAIGVIVTPMFNASRGSILLPILLHWQLNNPLFPDAAPYDTPLFVAAAVVVAIVNRRQLFGRELAVTDVVPPGSRRRADACTKVSA